MKLPIYRMLNISTGHISSATAEALNDPPSEFPWVIPHEYGWIVWVYQDEDSINIPDDLATVLKFAKDNKCEFVKFDCAAALIDNLPKFEW